jgi:prepilin-type N-terminal cleavage/methylation domain-containing protein
MAPRLQRERVQMNQHTPVRRAQSGYSLVEMLTVVAIIGVVSLVTVPQFLAYQRSNQLKTSMRQVMNDLRSVRQQAISMRTDARLRFKTGESTYVLERRAPNGTWVGLARHTTEPTVRSIESNCRIDTPVDLLTDTVGGETFNVIQFRADGTSAFTGGVGKGSFVVRTDHALTITAYTLEVHIPGFVKAL